MPTIAAPDGTHIDFPDSMQDSDIETAMGKLYPKPSPVSNAMSHAEARLSELPGAVGDAVIHPIDTVRRMYGQQKQLASEGIDAAKSGDYPLAAARGVETLMPGVGPSIASGFKTIRSGDTSGGVGDMIGTVGPALALRGSAMSPKVRAFTRGAYEAAKEPTSAHFGPFRVSVPVPAPIAGGVTGSVIGGHFGVPGLGATIGTVAPLIRGGMRAAEGENWLPSAPETIPNPFMPSSTRLLNRGGIPMPPPDASDASYVRGTPGMAYPPNPTRAIAPPPVVTAMPGDVTGDTSYVRGVPAMTQPPNTGRALPPAPRTLITEPPPDPSYVRGIDAQYPEIIQGRLTPPDQDLAPLLQRSIDQVKPKTPFRENVRRSVKR